MSRTDPLRQALASPKPWRAFALRAALTLCLLTALIAIAKPAALLDAVARAPLGGWLATAAGLLAGHVVAALKWRGLLRAAGAACAPALALRAHGAGLFANLFLPSLVGGDVVRAAALARGSRSTAMDGVETVAAVATGSIADRLIDTLALVLLAAVGAILVRSLDPSHWSVIVAIAVAVVAAPWIALRLLRGAPPSWLPMRAASLAARAREAAIGLEIRPVALALALSLAVQLGFVWLNARLGAALGIDLPFGVWLLCWPLAKLAALLPISLGGLGVREAALAALLAGFGVVSALAVAQSLLWQTALIAVGGLAGGLAFTTTPASRSDAAPRDAGAAR